MLRKSILALAFALLCASCGKPPADPATRATGLAREPVPAPVATGEMATADTGSASIRYACDDGSTLGVRYADDQARIEFPDGRTVALPKAQSASKGGGEAFVGKALALQRDGDDIQLHRGERPALRCRGTGT